MSRKPPRRTPAAIKRSARPIKEAKDKWRSELAGHVRAHSATSAKLAKLGREYEATKAEPPSEIRDRRLDDLRRRQGELRLRMGFRSPPLSEAKNKLWQGGRTAQRIAKTNRELRAALDDAIRVYSEIAKAASEPGAAWHFVTAQLAALEDIRPKVEDALRIFVTLGVERPVAEKRRGRKATQQGVRDAVIAAREELLAVTGKEPSPSELAKELGLSVGEIDQALHRTRKPSL
jgi:DNA-directed RNA polymerase specialized sigma24 family protein